MVVYVPHIKGSDDSIDVLGRIKAARVDLATGQTTEHSAVTRRELTRLHGVFAFMEGL
jgi:hypothetical protein